LFARKKKTPLVGPNLKKKKKKKKNVPGTGGQS